VAFLLAEIEGLSWAGSITAGRFRKHCANTIESWVMPLPTRRTRS